MKSASLKGAISMASCTARGIPALSGTACGKLAKRSGARLICASALMP
jgi:hypothetical protein